MDNRVSSLCSRSFRLEDSRVELFKRNHLEVYQLICSLTQQRQKILFIVIALGQGKALELYKEKKKLNELADVLCEMDEFYASLGGVIGYQSFIEELISTNSQAQVFDVEAPTPIDLRDGNNQLDRYVLEGIKRQKDICEILPCGGAADRLALIDEKEGKEYPAACFSFNEISLLERIIRDLVGREYLHEKCFHSVIETPIVIMTSHEKNNTTEIEAMCKKKNWFGRSPDSIHIVVQPSVPMFDKDGRWVCSEEGEMIMRPGGHGVLWRLLQKSGVYADLKSKGIEKGVVRQINNPAAGIDTGILALVGIGYLKKKKFGFTSCPRILRMKEGVNVIKLFKDKKNQTKKVVSNIEYCDFAQLEKIDCVETFPANTNTLFVDLDSVKKAQEEHPFPGLILNFKEKQDRALARLESTMQNIADPIQLMQSNSAFLTLNDRSKSLVAIKRKKEERADLKETPEQAFFELMKEGGELLKSCNMQVPEIGNAKKLNYIFNYHPALGPLYSIIKQKIIGGIIRKGSKIYLEIAEVYLKNLTLDGELNINTKYITKDVAKCYLKDVAVQNKVIITLGKKAEFFAENITIEDGLTIDVPDYTSLVITQAQKGLEWHYSPVNPENNGLWEAHIHEDKINLQLKIQLPVHA